MLAVSCLVFLLSFILGIYIMESVVGSRYLLFVGIMSVLFGLGYTGGPFPLAYNGMGDIFVIFFWLCLVLTTHW